MSQDLLATYTDLDSKVRKAEKELSELQGQLTHYEQREREIYQALGVDNFIELEARVESLKVEVGTDMADWNVKVQKVNEIIREVEQRVAR